MRRYPVTPATITATLAYQLLDLRLEPSGEIVIGQNLVAKSDQSIRQPFLSDLRVEPRSEISVRVAVAARLPVQERRRKELLQLVRPPRLLAMQGIRGEPIVLSC